MDGAALKAQLQAYATEIGIDEFRVTTADPFLVMKQRLIQQQEKGYASGFEEPDLDRRTTPTLLLDDAVSIIAIAVAYPSKLKDAPRGKEGERRGIFGRSSWGLDYHQALKNRLMLLEEKIHTLSPGSQTRSMVDTGELVDRAVAERAGIGFSGKNCSIISETHGSYLYLGELITDCYLPPDEAVEELCGSCTKCMDACPTDALVEPGVIDAKRCISFITQTKTLIPEDFRYALGNRLYGCDTCQQVCPYNRKKHATQHAELQPDPEQVKPLLIPLLSLSNREFKTRFGSLSGAWRGKKPIQRNAVCALVHYQDRTALDALRTMAETDQREDMRALAIWAIGRISGQEAEGYVQDRLSVDAANDVQVEGARLLDEWRAERAVSSTEV
ncbi:MULTISPECIES: tRNA epoxyqueuosine(34) reductase QueG [Exiguobacterium]|uniref:tRNA epoxyqueuosine(34) reductase QueG n=1 Tax=Exiguobacterium antarcticum TaxID=132920 RepID=A0ABT6R3P4_9BACL|nr:MULTISPECIES: tRNA epoxyqueuosine(34) reductase QueG [Exiguobacterium]AFS69786.1 Iron-sulfur cluster binding protein [Exiguobacterium antarcticum B7]MCT4780536.1 tRNA epoxyqueuosine(34) reductase QueG [Exiguobacterium soli]MDI3235575.1 tRNA epoxyqueuosine(34) reductase QueG [Exiguobacterium antarcticum]